MSVLRIASFRPSRFLLLVVVEVVQFREAGASLEPTVNGLQQTVEWG